MTDDVNEERATFKTMTQGSAEDWAKVAAGKKLFNRDLPNRVLAHLKLLEGKFWGFPVDRLTHSLQSATIAHRAGMDEEYVVCALLHDIGYSVGPWNHAEIGAAILRPFVSEGNHWMVAIHNIFEGYYFFHHFGEDRNARERFRGHPYFEQTAHFCETFDQCAFDSEFEAMPLQAFVPLVQRVFASPRGRIPSGTAARAPSASRDRIRA